MMGYQSKAYRCMQHYRGFLLGHPIHTILYTIPPPASRPPSRKETPRRRVLYRITRQLLHRVSTASFESCRVNSTGISSCFQPGQAKVVLGPTPLSVSALSAGAYTAALYVMVIGWKGVGMHPPPILTSQGWIFHHDGGCTPEIDNRHSVCTLWFIQRSER